MTIDPQYFLENFSLEPYRCHHHAGVLADCPIDTERPLYALAWFARKRFYHGFLLWPESDQAVDLTHRPVAEFRFSEMVERELIDLDRMQIMTVAQCRQSLLEVARSTVVADAAGVMSFTPDLVDGEGPSNLRGR